MASTSAELTCPCLSGRPYSGCCGPRHDGSSPAGTAEALMRSRFSAFALGLPDYLLATWDRSTRPVSLELDPDVRWYRLDILATTEGGPLDSEGTVEFTARYWVGNTPGVQREVSTFRRADGLWFYVDGSQAAG